MVSITVEVARPVTDIVVVLFTVAVNSVVAGTEGVVAGTEGMVAGAEGVVAGAVVVAV